MQKVFPDYYPEFRCIAGACKHSCCIGWEIDIDEKTASYYRTIPGELGIRLRSQIEWGEVAHFRLGDRERCPFLNEENLCDLILELGEDRLCGICAEHPRFHNELPGRIESGVGLCCEAAGRLVLGKSSPMQLIVSGEPACEDEIVALRDELLAVLQDRTISLDQRLDQMLEQCGVDQWEFDPAYWTSFLFRLERLDEAWSNCLTECENEWKHVDLAAFAKHMQLRMVEYEQFAVYLLYRHFANGVDEDDLAARALFVAFGVSLLFVLGAVSWAKSGTFSLEDQVELARLFSSELEYSEENLDAILDELFEAFR